MKIMRRKITAATNSGTYIGGRLFDLPESYYEDYDAQEARAEEQNKYIYNFAKNYIIYWNNGKRIEFTTDLDISWDIIEAMAIKEGIDVVAYPDHIDVLGYYGRHVDTASLYPVSDAMVDELIDAIDNSDFDETTTIDGLISQYAWNGASAEDVIKSWR